jgi:hypothetical protein
VGKISCGLIVVIAVFGLWAGMGFAADYQAMTTAELNAIRGTHSNATPADRDAFRSEWTSRLDKMTPAEREQYVGSGPGKGRGLQDGTGRPEALGNGVGGGNGARGSAGGGGYGNDSGPGDGSGRGDSGGKGGNGGGNGSGGGNGGGKGRS